MLYTGYISFKDLKKGYLIFTNDGGMHWSQINLPAYQNLTHISFKDPLNGIGSIYDSHSIFAGKVISMSKRQMVE
jgi:hypothetical protein